MRVADITDIRFNGSDVRELSLNGNVVWRRVRNASQWTALPRLSESVEVGTVGGVNGRIYIIGGHVAGVATANDRFYNTQTNTYTNIAKITHKVNNMSSEAPVIGDLIYVIGGAMASSSQTTYCQVYNTTTGTWSQRASIPPSYTVTTSSSAIAVGGMIHVMNANGYSSGYYHKLYNPQTNTWSSLSACPELLCNSTLIAMDGYIYHIGGVSGLTWAVTNPSVYRYSIAMDTWSSFPSFNIARQDHVSGLLMIDGQKRMVITAGRTASASSTNVTEYYDGTSWRQAPALYLPIPIGIASSTVHNDVLYLFGGWLKDSDARHAYCLK